MRERLTLWRTRLGYIILCVAVAASLALFKITLDRVCESQQHDWRTWQRVVGNIRHPALATGQQLTDAQTDALNRYADQVAASVGPKPDC